jgi:hypothetical protein
MRIVVSLLLVWMIGIACCCAEEPGFKSEDALRLAIVAAIENKSRDDYLNCSCLDRMPERTKALLRGSTPKFITHKVESVQILPGAKDPFAGYTSDFEYNVEFKGVVEVKYENEEQPINMPYGIYKGRYYLATLVKAGRYPK